MLKHKIILGLAAAPIFAAGLGSSSDVSAYSQYKYTFDTKTATCSQLNSVINSSTKHTDIYLTEDCTTNVVVPTGKDITLITKYWQDPTDDSTFGDPYVRLSSINLDDTFINKYKTGKTSSSKESVHTLASNNGVTLSIAPGAKVTFDGVIDGSAEGAVNNQGTFMSMGTIKKAVLNTGKLYLNGGDYTSTIFQNSGSIKINDGKFSSSQSNLKQFITTGSIVNDNNNGIFTVSMRTYGWKYYSNIHMPIAVDIRQPKYAYVNSYQDAIEASTVIPVSSDAGVLSITGSAASNFKLTGQKPGVVGVTFENAYPMPIIMPQSYAEYNQMYHEVLVYQLSSSINDATAGLINSIINNQFKWDNEGGSLTGGGYEVFKRAVADATPIALSIRQELLAENQVSSDDVAKIREVAQQNNAEVEQYYNLGMSIVKESDASELINLSELGNDTDGSEITQTFTLPAPDLGETNTADDTFQVYRVHNGVAEVVPSSTKDGQITFETSKFSTYAIGHRSNSNIGVPNTGAGSVTDIIVSVVAPLVAGSTIAVIAIREMRKRGLISKPHRVKFTKQ